MLSSIFISNKTSVSFTKINKLQICTELIKKNLFLKTYYKIFLNLNNI